MFRWLQLGRIGWQVAKMNPLGNLQLGAGVPTGSVHDHNDVLFATGTGFTGEVRERQTIQLHIHGGQGQPEELACAGIHKTVQVEPFVSPALDGYRALSLECPHAPQSGYETNASLVFGPQFDESTGVFVAQRLENLTEFFLNSSFAWGGDLL